MESVIAHGKLAVLKENIAHREVIAHVCHVYKSYCHNVQIAHKATCLMRRVVNELCKEAERDSDNE